MEPKPAKNKCTQKTHTFILFRGLDLCSEASYTRHQSGATCGSLPELKVHACTHRIFMHDIHACMHGHLQCFEY